MNARSQSSIWSRTKNWWTLLPKQVTIARPVSRFQFKLGNVNLKMRATTTFQTLIQSSKGHLTRKATTSSPRQILAVKTPQQLLKQFADSIMGNLQMRSEASQNRSLNLPSNRSWTKFTEGGKTGKRSVFNVGFQYTKGDKLIFDSSHTPVADVNTVGKLPKCGAHFEYDVIFPYFKLNGRLLIWRIN